MQHFEHYKIHFSILLHIVVFIIFFGLAMYILNEGVAVRTSIQAIGR